MVCFFFSLLQDNSGSMKSQGLRTTIKLTGLTSDMNTSIKFQVNSSNSFGDGTRKPTIIHGFILCTLRKGRITGPLHRKGMQTCTGMHVRVLILQLLVIKRNTEKIKRNRNEPASLDAGTHWYKMMAEMLRQLHRAESFSRS